MTLQVIGSGLGRTGTMSLKAALEQLLGGPCYHMIECIARPEHTLQWRAAVDDGGGRDLDGHGGVDWEALFDGFVATVDWPSASCWRALAEAYPEALILHSQRPADAWFRSADRTIFEMFKVPREAWPAPEDDPWWDMALTMLEQTFSPDFLDREAAMAAAEAWNADVLSTAPTDRLLVWQPGDGWEPLCAALGVPVPDTPFPHANSTSEFREGFGLDAP